LGWNWAGLCLRGVHQSTAGGGKSIAAPVCLRGGIELAKLSGAGAESVLQFRPKHRVLAVKTRAMAVIR
jgi:hypothetical protein